MVPAGLHDMAGVEARVGPKCERAGRPRSSHTPDELSDEALRPSSRSGRSLAEPDVEDLAGLCTRANQWVVAEDLGVAEGGALLVVSVHRTDRRVDVDGHRLGTGPRAERPRPGEHRLGDLVELADVAEAESAGGRSRASKAPSPCGRAPPRSTPSAARRRHRCIPRRRPSRARASRPDVPGRDGHRRAPRRGLRGRASRSAPRRERDPHRPRRGRRRTSPTSATGCAKMASKRCLSDPGNGFFGESNSP